MRLAEDIKNYMETLVEEEIALRGLAEKHDNDYLQDLFCLTLNALPPKYVRYAIDVLMYMSNEERAALQKQVTRALNDATIVMGSNRRKESRSE